MISIAYYDLGALFPADNYRHFGGLSYYRPAAYVGPCWPQIGQKSIFCAISASPLKIKLQSTVRAQELTPTTPTDKWALVIRVYDTPVLMKGVWIFNPGGMSNRENLYGNMYEKLKVPNSYSLQNRNYHA